MRVMLVIFVACYILFSPIKSESNHGIKKVLSIVKDIKKNMINVDDIVNALTPIIKDNCACCDLPKYYQWIRVFYHNTDGGLFSGPEDALSKNVDDPNAQLYSILGQLDDYRSGGLFHFRLCYPELVGVNDTDGCNEWTQTSNPATESTINGFQPISLSFKMNESWVGIGKDVSGKNETFIDYAPTHSSWYTAIGSYNYWPSSETTIPGPANPEDWKQYAVNEVELYVRLEWIKVFKHNTAGGLFSGAEDAYCKNVDDPNADLYSILCQLEDYRSDGRFRFRLCYPELVGVDDSDGCNEWTQTSNPATESTITGFQPISLSLKYNSILQGWAGIGKDIIGDRTFIDDAPNNEKWFTAIGAYEYWGGATTIPGPRNPAESHQYVVNEVELYVTL